MESSLTILKKILEEPFAANGAAKQDAAPDEEDCETAAQEKDKDAIRRVKKANRDMAAALTRRISPVLCLRRSPAPT